VIPLGQESIELFILGNLLLSKVGWRVFPI